MNIELIITSDMHIGSKLFRPELLEPFLSSLPPGIPLVLNGDTIHDDKWNLFPPGHLAALDMLVAESGKRRVVWISGNHDRNPDLANRGKLEFADRLVHRNSVLILHGQHFLPFRWILRLIILLLMKPLGLAGGRSEILASRYSKRMPWLYSMLTHGAVRNVTAYARKNGFKMVICGHTHAREDRMENGVRYVNTGSWVNEPWCALVSETDIVLTPADGRSLSVT